MANVTAEIVASKRWFFWPAVAAIVALDRLGLIRDRSRATGWLVDHAMRLEVR